MSFLAESGIDGALIAAAFLLSCLGLGSLVYRRAALNWQTWLEQAAIGLAAFGLLTLALAQLGLFRPWALVFPAACLPFGLRQFWRSRALLDSIRPRTAFERLALASLIWLLGFGLLAALGPEMEPDALSYHLPAAMDFARTGGDPFNPSNYPTAYPLLGEACYAWLALLGRPEAARVLHWLVALLAVLATALMGRRVAGRQGGLLAAVLLAGVPMVVWTAHTANTDCFGMLFFVLAILRLEDHLRRGFSGDALAGAWYAGMAAGVKIWNLLLLPLLAAAVLAFQLRLARQRRVSILPALAFAFLFGSVGVLVYLPWAVRAFALTGDPIYPMLTQLSAGPAGDFFRFVAERVREGYGAGTGLTDLLLIGWRLTFNPELFGHLPIGWLLLPLLAFGLARVRRWPLLALLTPMAGVALLVWFATSQQVRYLAPLFPYAAVLSAAPVMLAAERRRWLPALVVVLALSGWGPLALYQWPQAGFVPHVWPGLLSGETSRDQVRERYAYNDEWSLWRFANAALPDNAAVLGDGAQARLWAEREFIDLSYDPASFAPVIVRALKESGPLRHRVGYLATTPKREAVYAALPGERGCRLYTNGHLVLRQRLAAGQECRVPPLTANEAYRWLEVASPRDGHGYWWLGERATLLARPGTRLEVIAPFVEQGVRELVICGEGAEEQRITIDDRAEFTLMSSADRPVELTAPHTVNPADLGFAGDPTPKSFLVRFLE